MVNNAMLEIGTVGTITKTVTENDISVFADISGDYNPLHVNEHEAQKSMFGRRIAHGFLVGSLISAAIGMGITKEMMVYLEQSMKFIQPVYIGDTCTAEVVVDERLNKEKEIYRLNTRVFNQKNQVVIDGYAIVMCLGRGEA